MARYVTTIASSLPPADAFVYMAAFEHALDWDPSVTSAHRLGEGELGLGSAFQVVSRFAGRAIPLRYEIVEFDPPRRVVLEARRKGFRSVDTITVEPHGVGARVTYDAALPFAGIGRLVDPLLQLVFDRVGRKAAAGLERSLNP
jgi:hypothetical protein